MLDLLKKHDKDIRFLFNAAALVFILMAVMQAIQPYLAGPDPRAPEIEAYVDKIVPVSANAVPALLHGQKDRPIMLVLYASWCPYCKFLMPDIVTMMKEGQMSNVNTVFLSFDYEPLALSAYLVHNEYKDMFKPYLLVKGNLASALQGTGSHFAGKIPYVGFFDAEGKLITDLPGETSKQQLLDTVAHLGAAQ